MTDWLPWGFAFMVGTFTTLALVLRALGATPVGQRPDLRAAWWALALAASVSLVVFLFYVLWGEGWVWYLR